MQNEETFGVTTWFKENVINSQLKAKYIKLQTKIEESVRQPTSTFESEKNDLFNSLKEINFDRLTDAQINMLNSFDILDTLGKNGIENLESILYKNVHDKATVIEKMKDITLRITKTEKEFLSLNTILSKMITKESSFESLDDDEVLMRVRFHKEVSINNIDDFEKNAKKWSEIGRGIALAHNKTPQDIKVVGAGKGSIIIELATNIDLASSIIDIVKDSLLIALSIKETKETIDKLRDSGTPEKFLTPIEDDNTKKDKEKIKETEEKLIKSLNVSKENEGHLRKSISHILDFTTKGGELDYISKNEDFSEGEGAVQKTKMLESRSEMRKIKDKIKLIENKKIDS